METLAGQSRLDVLHRTCLTAGSSALLFGRLKCGARAARIRGPLQQLRRKASTTLLSVRTASQVPSTVHTLQRRLDVMFARAAFLMPLQVALLTASLVVFQDFAPREI